MVIFYATNGDQSKHILYMSNQWGASMVRGARSWRWLRPAELGLGSLNFGCAQVSRSLEHSRKELFESSNPHIPTTPPCPQGNWRFQTVNWETGKLVRKAQKAGGATSLKDTRYVVSVCALLRRLPGVPQVLLYRFRLAAPSCPDFSQEPPARYSCTRRSGAGIPEI